MKSPSVTLFILAVVISMMYVACSPVIYATTGQNVPMFQAKGEVSVNASISAAVDANETDYVALGLGIQASAAVSSNVAVIGSFSGFKEGLIWETDPASESESYGSGMYGDLGVGLFKFNQANGLIREVFIGCGWGEIRNSYSIDELGGDFLNVRFVKPFIQPTIGISKGNFELAFTPRIALVSSKFNVGLGYAHDRKDKFVLEPGLTFRVGSSYLKFQYQFNYSTYSTEDVELSAYNFYMSGGMCFMFSKHR